MTATRKHRHRAPAITRRQLQAEVADLRRRLAGADRLIEGQQQRIEEQGRQAARLVARYDREVCALRAKRVDAGVFARQLATAEAHIRQLAGENVALKANIANRDSVSVPPMHRDVDPGDQATAPTDVRPLREHYVVPLAQGLGGAA